MTALMTGHCFFLLKKQKRSVRSFAEHGKSRSKADNAASDYDQVILHAGVKPIGW
jgi:hypothetical protein